MNGVGEVLMSTRELGCRRTNYQAEKYLSKVIGQLEVEKHLVERDWDRKMKTLILQKQKRIPKVLENKNKPNGLRPRSAWEGTMHKNYILTRPQTATSPHYSPSPVPRHWHFLASYTATPDGKRIPNPSPASNAKSEPNHRDLQSARPPVNVKKISIRPRRATSAPVRRSGLSTCIITQTPIFSDELVQLQHQNNEEEVENGVLTNGTGIISTSTPRKKHHILPLPSQIGLGNMRPQSAVSAVKQEHSRSHKVNGRLSKKNSNSHSNLQTTSVVIN